MSSTSANPAASGNSTTVSSNRTTPGDPGMFTVAQGMTCFWPSSAIAANHAPFFSRRRKARVTGFSPLLALA